MSINAAAKVAEHDPAMTTDTRIPVSRATRELVKAQKRGGETYDDLLRNMVTQYDPDEAKN
jgi:hypothetical protein